MFHSNKLTEVFSEEIKDWLDNCAVSLCEQQEGNRFAKCCKPHEPGTCKNCQGFDKISKYTYNVFP